MKKLLVTVVTVLGIMMAIPSSQAAEILGLNLKFAPDLNLMDAIGVAQNSENTETNPESKGLVAGLFTGSLAGLYNTDGSKPIGFLGFTVYASNSIDSDGVTWLPTINPVTFFNDQIHLDVGRNLNDEGWTVGFGFSGIAAGEMLWDQTVGRLTPEGEGGK